VASVSAGVSQVSLRYLLVSFSVIGASSFPPGDSFGKVMDAARYVPDLLRLHRILLIPNVCFFTFFPDVHTMEIKKVERMAYLIPLKLGKVWLVNNRIHFIT